jgi:hypothetical protein
MNIRFINSLTEIPVFCGDNLRSSMLKVFGRILTAFLVSLFYVSGIRILDTRFMLYAYRPCFVLSCIIRGKGKVVPVFPLSEHHSMKAYCGSEDRAPCIL